jgi:hypothetical protein
MEENDVCSHKNYSLDRNAGYTCDDCGIQLVYCVKCAMDQLLFLTKPWVHAYPECNDAAERVWAKDAPGRNRRGTNA